jgi:N-dimethylarginine dimethylaminohydrolase
MCRPTHFTVEYTINPWMDPAKPVDTPLAVTQWEQLREVYLRLGHTIDTVPARPGLPDMVYAANGATVIDRRVLVARFRHAERVPEADAYLEWFADAGYADVRQANEINEGEGDYLVLGDVVLAGSGFRSTREAHTEAQEYFGRPVVTLTLVDPRYYHLDTALAVLDDGQIMYYPPAFSAQSRELLRDRFPDAIVATDADAAVFGLNAVSDGRHVVLPQAATGLIDQLRRHGYEPIGIDLSELLRGGGSAKCCTLELRAKHERKSTTDNV